jgi:N-acetylmuramoyl-L-alanine amidase
MSQAHAPRNHANDQGELAMTYNRIVISSGHGLYVRGASGVLDEVDEARNVVEEVATRLRARDIEVDVFHDDETTTQNENLNAIVNHHNSKTRDLDISVHFNAYVETPNPMGTEVLYVTQSVLAGEMSAAIASVGFLNRGPKKCTDLFFLNNTEMPAILLETCFVDSQADADVYRARFNDICEQIVSVIAGEGGAIERPERPDRPEWPDHPAPPEGGYSVRGKVSWFGGPGDTGVSASEGLAFIYDVMDRPEVFLPYQPENTTGLARRLNPHVHYVACRWNYDKVSKAEMLQHIALVRSLDSGVAMKAFPADWGPHESTGRVADVSPGLLADLGLTTDDEVEVIFPYKE